MNYDKKIIYLYFFFNIKMMNLFVSEIKLFFSSFFHKIKYKVFHIR